MAALGGLVGTGIIAVLAVLTFVDGESILVYKRDMLTWKLARLEDPDRPPQLIVIAGSNVLYSIDSQALAEETGLPVTNAGQHWGLALYAGERIADRLRPGDVVLAPLEYEFYALVDDMQATEACYLIAHDRTRIGGLSGWIKVLTTCSPVLLFGGVAIRLMGYVGLRYPRFDMADILTAEGDMMDNVEERSSWRVGLNGPRIVDSGDTPLRFGRLERIVAAWRAKGAVVLLSFPALPESAVGVRVVGEAWLAKFRAWATEQGAHVVSSPAAHRFPVRCFFDSPYHLHQGCTAANSRIYAKAIKPFLP